jgi:MbtH protein
MENDKNQASETYKVVVNHEEQYSILPHDHTPPLGWKEVGVRGTKAECLIYIEQVWTDMRPLSVRRQMHQGAEK